MPDERKGRNSELSSARTFKIMGRLVHRAVKKPGAAPGTMIHTGRRKVEEVRVRFLDYDAGELREEPVDRVEECFPFKGTPTVSWVNIDGLHDVDMLKKLEGHFGFHPLMMEDVVSLRQRAKSEEYGPHLFVVLHMLSLDAEHLQINAEQMSLILGDHYVFTFQERYGDVFDPVRERIRAGRPRLREGGPDYLAYSLVDAVVDSYFHVLNQVGDRIESLEEDVVTNPGPEVMERIHHLKREMLVMRRAVWPLRDALSNLVRGDSERISDQTRLFLRDVYDHTVQVIDTVETLRDVLSGAMDLYLSSVGHRTNEVMKVLTIMASIFIPLTFMAGIYGMNFQYMPELSVPWAYPALLGAMVAIGGTMVWYFKRKGWM